MRPLAWKFYVASLGLISLSACGGSSATSGTDARSPETESNPELPETVVSAPAEGPSTGCDATGAAGDFNYSLAGTDAPYRITLPPNYDPTVPTPFVFAFHGRGRTHIELQEIDAAQIQTEIESRAIVAYLKSQNGSGWNASAEVEPNIEFFEGVYGEVLSSYCVDTAKVFAIGHSSGGYFSNILGCRFGDRIRAIGAVAGAQQESACQGQVAAIVVHGVRDSVVSFESGQQSRAHYRNENRCSESTSPASTAPCVEYSDCDSGFPVQWCEHNEPTYQDTNHGWPSFASKAIADFLFALP